MFNRLKKFVTPQIQGVIKYAVRKRRFVIPGVQSILWLVIVTFFLSRTKSAAAMNTRISPTTMVETFAQQQNSRIEQQDTYIQSRIEQIWEDQNFLNQVESYGGIRRTLQKEYFALKQRLGSRERLWNKTSAKKNRLSAEYSNVVCFEQTKPINQRDHKKVSTIYHDLTRAEEEMNREEKKIDRLQTDLRRFVSKVKNVESPLPRSGRLIDRIHQGENPISSASSSEVSGRLIDRIRRGENPLSSASSSEVRRR